MINAIWNLFHDMNKNKMIKTYSEIYDFELKLKNVHYAKMMNIKIPENYLEYHEKRS
jgi:hypothetical protein